MPSSLPFRKGAVVPSCACSSSRSDPKWPTPTALRLSGELGTASHGKLRGSSEYEDGVWAVASDRGCLPLFYHLALLYLTSVHTNYLPLHSAVAKFLPTRSTQSCIAAPLSPLPDQLFLLSLTLSRALSFALALSHRHRPELSVETDLSVEKDTRPPKPTPEARISSSENVTLCPHPRSLPPRSGEPKLIPRWLLSCSV